MVVFGSITRGVLPVARCRYLGVLGVLAAAVVLGPSAFARPDGSGRAMDCALTYRPACTITFTITRVSASSSPAANAPNLQGNVEFSIKPLNIDGCSVVSRHVTLTGANAGQNVYENPDYGHNTLWVW
jgi:hypothetical protein